MASLRFLQRLLRVYRDTRGTEIVEFALVVPMLLLVLGGIIDMGFLFNNYEVVTNAAREGARLAAVPGWTESDVKTRVNAYIGAAGLTTASVTTTVTPVAIDVGGKNVNGVKVLVSYPYTFSILGPMAAMVQGGTSFTTTTLRAAATMRTEVAAGL
jgi:Flp pilus assembly protein TadG